MKKYNFILISVLFFCFSCGLQHKRNIERKYVLENKTNKEITIELYINMVKFHSSSINQNGVLLERIVMGSRGKDPTAMWALASDSIIVTFDKKKKQIFTNISRSYYRNITPSDKTKNILFDDAYKVESNTLYRYTFTEEDYNNAADL